MGIKLCPKCNGKVSTSRNVCVHCGYAFPLTKKCPDCGEDVDIKINECPSCGYFFAVNSVENISNNNRNNDSIKTNDKSNIECPYCKSKRLMPISKNYYMCETCKNKFFENENCNEISKQSVVTSSSKTLIDIKYGKLAQCQRKLDKLKKEKSERNNKINTIFGISVFIVAILAGIIYSCNKNNKTNKNKSFSIESSEETSIEESRIESSSEESIEKSDSSSEETSTHIHEYEEFYNMVKEPTLTETGLASRDCVAKDDTETVVLPVLTNTSVWKKYVFKEATCTTEGRNRYVSSKYGLVVYYTFPIKDHVISDYKVSSITLGGKATVVKECEVCHKIFESKELTAPKQLALTIDDNYDAYKDIIVVDNTSSYPFIYDETTGTWTTSNKGVNSSRSSMSFKGNVTGTLEFDVVVSSESSDKFSYVEGLIGGSASQHCSVSITSTGTTYSVYYSKDGSVSSGTDTAIISNLIFKADCLPDGYVPDGTIVSFNTLGGSEVADVFVFKNSIIDNVDAIPTKDGYIFDGWYLDENCINKLDTNKGLSSNTTLYASWKKESEFKGNYYGYNCCGTTKSGKFNLSGIYNINVDVTGIVTGKFNDYIITFVDNSTGTLTFTKNDGTIGYGKYLIASDGRIFMMTHYNGPYTIFPSNINFLILNTDLAEALSYQQTKDGNVFIVKVFVNGVETYTINIDTSVGTFTFAE